MARRKKKKKKTPAKKETSKLDEWEKEEDTLMKSMTATHKALAERPTSKFSLPKLPAPKDNPVPVIGSTGETPKKKKKKKSSPKEEPTISEEPVEEVVEVKEAPKTREPKKKRSSSKKRKAAAVGTAPGRLIPIVKRTKRVRKIS